ncbi:hypothetical protein ASPACDRAFT_111359 [Aspergillus aculeatus ATCC 16872]|uniref:RRM domain-containing protein n=1 Tax=Aspergillus aculeatus (strain ATCC 16872 / CBS 172.66 / WB 5094) TaxID=690307 RepID=A0A1L9X518_ASPA1|nr:uncharacterized protein ASPACDRAFT_111359 [Aspergillus aculeatus ATCC 16872]OJK03541.1 hypothetical protein ASPACDRAFT_111359 [Aspergillus aculeatus ATCC 16872]
MAPQRNNGTSIFLGNIPYNLTEEQIRDILGTAGTVTKFRLMINQETGKPKGYGFADYADADSAASAVRNLNDYEVMGRKIRVDWPHNNEKDSVPPEYLHQNTGPAGAAAGQQDGLGLGGAGGAGGAQPAHAPLPPLPPGVEVPPHLDCPNAISQTLASLPPNQLLDVLQQMKSLVMADPARATELLRQAPQLAYAIFQALLLMNLVDYSALGTVVEQAAVQTAAAAPPPPPAAAAAAAAQAFQNFPGQVSTPPMVSAPFGQQQPPQATPQQAAPQAIPGQEELLQQVLSMPQAAIDALPPMERSQILLLRQQLMQGGMR